MPQHFCDMKREAWEEGNLGNLTYEFTFGEFSSPPSVAWLWLVIERSKGPLPGLTLLILLSGGTLRVLNNEGMCNSNGSSTKEIIELKSSGQ